MTGLQIAAGILLGLFASIGVHESLRWLRGTYGHWRLRPRRRRVTCGDWHHNLCTQSLDHDSMCTPNGVDAYDDHLVKKYTGRNARARAQAEIDREALESRGVQIPDTDTARIIAARARTQHVGDQPMHHWRPW